MKSGSFQSMKLSKPLLRGIYKKGYKIPTPIQRKTIPIILDGHDVVAMARTGSGKTAAFLIPIIEKLKNHNIEKGVRVLILSPTRELALQTMKFTKEFTRFTDLKCETILGGDSMERQFAKIHENPDIIIATPGRLLHVAIEMDLKFSKVEMVVFDEADRLFEMGFKEQLNEILSRLPYKKQTLLFSATLPQTIVDFTKAGLVNPVLIRLDTESKISENLKLIHFGCRNEDKLATLVYLLKYIIKPNEQTIVFLPTRHHIEYIKEILDHSSIKSTYLYSSLDSEARKINIRTFYLKKVHVLLVTDLAARGVDIPLLDNVINYNFPSKCKLFVHRVGRTARAGRSGTAYSLVANDELPFLFSLSLFLNNPFKVANQMIDDCNENKEFETIYGSIPQNIIDEENEIIEKLHSQFSDLDSLKKVCNSAYKQYLKTREVADSESVKKMKQTLKEKIGYHPIFLQSSIIENKTTQKDLKIENERIEMLSSIKSYKPNTTIFELGKTKNSEAREIMKLKRERDADKLLNRKNIEQLKQTSKNEKFKDRKFYLNYQSGDFYFEKGLQLNKSFDVELKNAVLDFDGDENGQIIKNKNQLKWDRKKKRFTQGDEESKIKKIRTESGNWISASYKSGMYQKWKLKSKTHQKLSSYEENNNDTKRKRDIDLIRKNIQKNAPKGTPKRKQKEELKTKEEILKERRRLERIKIQRKKTNHKKSRKKESELEVQPEFYIVEARDEASPEWISGGKRKKRKKTNKKFYFPQYLFFTAPNTHYCQIRLKDDLKERYQMYHEILRSWFSLETNYGNFKESINSLLNGISIKKIHNEYITTLIINARCKGNIVEKTLHFFDILMKNATICQSVNSNLCFVQVCDDTDISGDEKHSEDDEEDEDEEEILFVKKKRKRTHRILDEDEEENHHNIDDDDDGDEDDEEEDVESEENEDNSEDSEPMEQQYSDENVSDENFNSARKKKRKRKAILLSSDEEDGNISETSSNFQTINDVNSVDSFNKINIARSSNNNERNFSLLSTILNSNPPMDNLGANNTPDENNINESQYLIDNGIQNEYNIWPSTNFNSNEPFNGCNTILEFNQNNQFPSSLIFSDAQIAELFNFQPISIDHENNMEYSQMSPLSSNNSPMINAPSALDSLSNSDDMGNSDNFLNVDNQMRQLLNPYRTESINSNDVSDSHDNRYDGVTSKPIQSFEIFDPIMDPSYNTLGHKRDFNNERKYNEKENNENDLSDITVKGMSSEEKISKLQTCFQEFSLPDNVRLGLRISQLATSKGFVSVDRKVTHICNIALKNFIRNILTHLIASRTSFLIRHNRIIYNAGGQPINPYLRNSFKQTQKELYPDLDVSSISSVSLVTRDFTEDTDDDGVDRHKFEENEECSRMASKMDKTIKIQKYGLNRNEMTFNEDDQIKLNLRSPILNKFRNTSGTLYVSNCSNKINNTSCNLYHLYDLLNTNRSLIPVTQVWSRTLYRTVAAFNNLPDSEK